jgi:hypothetical protein
MFNNLNKYDRLITVYIILIISFIYCIVVPAEYVHDSINQFQKKCYCDCKTDVCKYISSKRGDDYYIGYTEKEDIIRNKSCFLTHWNITHLLFYMLLSYIAPFYIFELFIIGISFELFEYKYYDCHDYWDIVNNVIGLAIGSSLSNYNVL